MPNLKSKNFRNNTKQRLLGGQHNDILDYLETTDKTKLKKYFLESLNKKGNSNFTTIRQVQEYYQNVDSKDKKAFDHAIKECFRNADLFSVHLTRNHYLDQVKNSTSERFIGNFLNCINSSKGGNDFYFLNINELINYYYIILKENPGMFHELKKNLDHIIEKCWENTKDSGFTVFYPGHAGDRI